MKYSLILLIMISPVLCQGQQKDDNMSIRSGKVPRDARFVYKAGDKTSDLLLYKQAKLESVDIEWIESISVVKDAAALSQYGDRAKAGVVIITFKSYDILSRELRMILTKSESK